MGRRELLKGLTDEQIKRVYACKSPEEIMNLAKSEGYELTDEQLSAVSGGAICGPSCCPRCSFIWYNTIVTGYYECAFCGYKWYTDDYKYNREDQ